MQLGTGCRKWPALASRGDGVEVGVRFRGRQATQAGRDQSGYRSVCGLQAAGCGLQGAGPKVGAAKGQGSGARYLPFNLCSNCLKAVPGLASDWVGLIRRDTGEFVRQVVPVNKPGRAADGA